MVSIAMSPSSRATHPHAKRSPVRLTFNALQRIIPLHATSTAAALASRLSAVVFFLDVCEISPADLLAASYEDLSASARNSSFRAKMKPPFRADARRRRPRSTVRTGWLKELVTRALFR